MDYTKLEGKVIKEAFKRGDSLCLLIDDYKLNVDLDKDGKLQVNLYEKRWTKVCEPVKEIYKTPKVEKKKKMAAIDEVFLFLIENKGANTTEIMGYTKFKKKKVQNIIQKLKRKKLIYTPYRGFYEAV